MITLGDEVRPFQLSIIISEEENGLHIRSVGTVPFGEIEANHNLKYFDKSKTIGFVDAESVVTLPTGVKLEVDFRGSFKMEGQKITARYIELIADGTHCLHEAVFDLNEKTNTFSFRKFV